MTEADLTVAFPGEVDTRAQYGDHFRTAEIGIPALEVESLTSGVFFLFARLTGLDEVKIRPEP